MNAINSIDYRDLLRGELVNRCRQNPSYSARAFARDLGISPGFLSQLFNRHKRLDETSAYRIGERLKWSGDRLRTFTTLVRYEKAKDFKVKDSILKELDDGSIAVGEFFNLEIDAITCISEWYHFAIVELAKTDEFDETPKSIAHRLGITQHEACLAVEQLKRLGLLEGSPLRATFKNYASVDVPIVAIKNFHASLLDKAKIALEDHPRDERDITGVTIAINPVRIPEAKSMIRNFRRRLMEYLQEGEKPTQVYHLAIQLFRLDKDDHA